MSSLTQQQVNDLWDEWGTVLNDNWDIAIQDGKIASIVEKEGADVDDIMEWLIWQLDLKISSNGPIKVKSLNVKLQCNPSESCIATIQGEPYTIAISGQTRFVGTVETEKLGTITIYQRFIGKTFYQYCHI